MSELYIQFKPKLSEEVKEKIKLQAEYQKRTHSPDFAPSDGVCWSCNRQIYEVLSKEYVSTRLITGCPLCHRSYCD